MRVTANQQVWLRDALSGLEGGSVRRYHDCMWLGFGDLWSELEQQLSGMGMIRTAGRHGENVQITERGAVFAKQLRGDQTRASA